MYRRVKESPKREKHTICLEYLGLTTCHVRYVDTSYFEQYEVILGDYFNKHSKYKMLLCGFHNCIEDLTNCRKISHTS